MAGWIVICCIEETCRTCESRALGSFTTSEFDVLFICLDIIH